MQERMLARFFGIIVLSISISASVAAQEQPDAGAADAGEPAAAPPDLQVKEVPEAAPDAAPEILDEPDAAPAVIPAAPAENVEEMVVTGSRVRRKDLTGSAPIAVISREQLIASGRPNIGEFLQTLPEQSNAL